MSLIRHTKDPITIEISDKIIGGTRIKRKVRVDSMSYSMSAPSFYHFNGGGEVVVNTTVLVFAVAEDGVSYGEELNGSAGFSSYQYTLRANNSSIVYATDHPEGLYKAGQVIGDTSLEQDPNSFKPGGILDDIDYMYEFEFFKVIAETKPIIVDDLIKQYVLTADAYGRF